MAFDSIFLCVYVVEAALKIAALGFKYFSDSWNNLGAHARVCVHVCVCVDGASGLLVEAEDKRGLAGRDWGSGRGTWTGARDPQRPLCPQTSSS